jgi:glycosyltransferase involved in cell wall biosynthesis
MLRLHGRARVSIGMSISDALSTSALEAMVMGSFPIQSNTSCLGELVRDGESGILVHPEDPKAVATALRRAVSDDALVDRAAEINARIAAEQLDQSVVRPRVVEMYERILTKARS